MTMTSEDVIHAFSVPAFRTKRDVVPGRYTTMWFEANKLGEYHLFCAEYCGTQHSTMIGKVVVMEPEDYQNWLSGGIGGELVKKFAFSVIPFNWVDLLSIYNCSISIKLNKASVFNSIII